MAEVTVANLSHSVQGNKRVQSADLSNVQNGFTWTTGFARIDTIDFTPTTNASFGCTVAGGVVTFVTGGTLAGKGSVEGF